MDIFKLYYFVMSSVGSVCKFDNCKKRLNFDTRNVLVCTKCSNIYHEDCVNNCGKMCINDNCNCSTFISENNLDTRSQDYINVLSTKKTKFKPGICDYLRLFKRIIPLMYYYTRFWWYSSKECVDNKELDIFLTGLHWCLNINVTVTGLEKIDPNVKKVFVGNHHSEHDALIIPLYIKAGVIASVSVNKTSIGRMMKKYTNTLTIKRGVRNNTSPNTLEKKCEPSTVDQMKTFLENEESNGFFVFPTSIFDQIKTLSKFRTGAFAMGYPIQPVILNYEQDISSINVMHILMLSRLDLKLTVLDLIYPKKNQSAKEFAEEVREIFRDIGGLKLSNVDTHDVRD